MTLYLDCLVDPDVRPVRVEVEAGAWRTVPHADPDAAVLAVAGTGPGVVGILLEGRQLAGLPAPQRSRAGLAVATARLAPIPTMRVADILLLGLRAPRPHLWQTLAGTTRARSMARDDEAHVRALAGRVGLARWLDWVAVDLPPEAQALADLTRALAANPAALVLRRPEWLDADVRAEIDAALHEEQAREGFAVAELVTAGAASLAGP